MTPRQALPSLALLAACLGLGCSTTINTGAVLVTQAGATAPAAVQPAAGGTATPKPGGIATTPKPAVPADGGREVLLSVLAPASLAATGGGILNDDPSGLIAAGGLNLISNTGTQLIAAGGLNYRLAASIDTLKPVEKAIVTFHELTPDGGSVSKLAAQTDAKGNVTVKTSGANRPLEVRAEFRLKGKTYRVAAPIPAGDLGGNPTMVDPINTIVAARIRAILKANGKTNPALLLTDLKDVWTAVNDSGATVDLAALDAASTLDQLDAFYTSLVAQIKDEAKKKVITDYMAKIRSGT